MVGDELRILFKLNPFKKELVIVYKDILAYMIDKGVEVVDDPSKADYLITLGGDGTLLYNRMKFQDYDLPILGIGTETSYICQAKTDSWQKQINKLISGEFVVETKTLIEVIFNNISIGTALNEVLIRNAFPKILKFEVVLNQRRAVNKFNFFADGFIVATPTGSSAHAYACYADIIEENSNSLVLVAVAAHRREFTPTYVNNSSVIDINLHDRENKNQKIELIIDGLCVFNIGEHDVIKVKKSSKKQKLIRI
ncbi:MAG: NAD(+)/NADH kinase [Candidatus Micrarchaeota archaeon]|nr:NAD(+)/NADH kinase [Candidatus Micrarchaeota archaeon]